MQVSKYCEHRSNKQSTNICLALSLENSAETEIIRRGIIKKAPLASSSRANIKVKSIIADMAKV
ncbi:hypothetical protein KEJ51_06980 [Candidatus Bathyarchaeota archaeon]|nr:hypothetical protein [Candidatus Bathyarchaeota archaeon]MBS7628996.1 hypothetical protein [Candidatus Bathyarchaeota archaeon]